MLSDTNLTQWFSTPPVSCGELSKNIISQAQPQTNKISISWDRVWTSMLLSLLTLQRRTQARKSDMVLHGLFPFHRATSAQRFR